MRPGRSGRWSRVFFVRAAALAPRSKPGGQGRRSNGRLMAGISEAELMDFLRAIEEGSVSLRPEFDPQDIYAGNVPYAASNGWHITIFNDCNEWDYVDRVKTADGRSLDFDTIENDMP